MRLKIQPKGTASELTHMEPSLQRVDLFLRYVMVATAAFPANCIPQLRKPVIVVLGTFQMVIILYDIL